MAGKHADIRTYKHEKLTSTHILSQEAITNGAEKLAGNVAQKISNKIGGGTSLLGEGSGGAVAGTMGKLLNSAPKNPQIMRFDL